MVTKLLEWVMHLITELVVVPNDKEPAYNCCTSAPLGADLSQQSSGSGKGNDGKN